MGRLRQARIGRTPRIPVTKPVQAVLPAGHCPVVWMRMRPGPQIWLGQYELELSHQRTALAVDKFIELSLERIRRRVIKHRDVKTPSRHVGLGNELTIWVARLPRLARRTLPRNSTSLATPATFFPHSYCRPSGADSFMLRTQKKSGGRPLPAPHHDGDDVVSPTSSCSVAGLGRCSEGSRYGRPGLRPARATTRDFVAVSQYRGHGLTCPSHLKVPS